MLLFFVFFILFLFLFFLIIFVVNLFFFTIIFKKLLIMSVFIHCFHHLLASWSSHQVCLSVISILTIFILIIVILHHLILLVHHFIFESLRTETLVSRSWERSNFLLQFWGSYCTIVLSELSFRGFRSQFFAFLIATKFAYCVSIITSVVGTVLTWSTLNWSNFGICFDRSTRGT